MDGKRKRSRNGRSRRNESRVKLTYVASILVLTFLVGAAFFSPGWLFDLQDSRRCRDTVLEERENVNVAALSTNYESSFYQRMVNFAENQADDTHYYVAAEELTDNDKLTDFLFSADGLYNDCIWMLTDMGMISDEITQCNISQWKQYVIYSDDYAKGVNFILWYIELTHPDKRIGTFKLLVEAGTGELYGLKSETDNRFLEKGTSNNKSRELYSLETYLESWGVYDESWGGWAYNFSGLAETKFFEFFEHYESYVYGREINASSAQISIDRDAEAMAADVELNAIIQKLDVEDEAGAWMEFLDNYPAVAVWDEGNRLECSFPYGEGSLVFRLKMAESIPYPLSYPYALRNITVGFPTIYELIPEFEE